ncbi:hypothetical protein MBLNU13_g05481t2 [Cladosporium sp. NU13]
MVLLNTTPTLKAAVDEYRRLHADCENNDPLQHQLARLEKAELDGPLEHSDVIDISKRLVNEYQRSDASTKTWRLDALLKGTTVYQPPPPPKPEPSAEYKALMQRLRQQEEQREYERMINPLPEKETFGQRFPNAAGASFNPNTYHGQTGIDGVDDDVTYQDIDRQVALIINVLVSIIACAVALWIVARHWSVPQRMALSMGGSLTVAAAEVAIYLGYIRRIEDAKGKEIKKAEKKEVSEMWEGKA